MLLWIIFAIITLAVIAILIVPLLGGAGADAPARVDYDIVVYRDQLAEIDQEIERGLLTESEAEAARAEIHRRMLAAEDAELKIPFKLLPSDSRYGRLGAIAAIALIVPLGAVVMYGVLGQPHLPGKPYAWRLKNDPDFVAASTAEKLAALLQNDPSAAGYQRLGQMYFDARNYEQAAVADRRAIELGANDPATWSELGEAVVMVNGGAVAPEAMAAFTKALSIEPRSERSRFYIGLAEAQIGNLKQAVAIWRDLEKDSPPDAPWLTMLRDHIAAFSKEGGFDPASVPPSPPSANTLNVANTAMANALHLATPNSAPAALPANAAPPVTTDPRDTMIQAMVQKLADKMEKNPGDAEGWKRLAHAYNVLGQNDKARAAIDHAVRLKPADIDIQLILAETQKAGAAPGDDTPADYIATMRTVLKLDPANPQALYAVGLAEQKAGHSDRARAMWTKALAATSPDDPLAISIRNRLDDVSGKTKSQ
ncbi:MAG: c-type cytochrome biogenesis protein CcmI [Rhizomicrobium sp.]